MQTFEGKEGRKQNRKNVDVYALYMTTWSLVEKYGRGRIDVSLSSPRGSAAGGSNHPCQHDLVTLGEQASRLRGVSCFLEVCTGPEVRTPTYSWYFCVGKPIYLTALGYAVALFGEEWNAF